MKGQRKKTKERKEEKEDRSEKLMKGVDQPKTATKQS